MRPLRHRLARRVRLLALPLIAAGLGACGAFRHVPLPAPVRLTTQVTEILDTEDPSPEFFRERARLQAMGPELDPVLVGLVRNASVDERVRANAAILLADRRAPIAVYLLRRELLTSASDALRAAAVIGLWKLSRESPQAAFAIRAAATDASPRVRLNVVQALDVEDAVLLRGMLARERDPQVLEIGRQLLAFFEARGAPLGADATGTLRGSGPDTLPRIVFQPGVRNPARVSTGALWVEMPGGALVPLAQRVEEVAGVVPAFFNPTHTAVVYEADREIRIRDLRSGTVRVAGAGIAPRVLPFTDFFLFLEERRADRREDGVETALAYDVIRGSFVAPRLERVGVLRATARTDRFGAASPARWMVIGEVREGFVLRGPGITPFLLPNPFEGARRAPTP